MLSAWVHFVGISRLAEHWSKGRSGAHGGHQAQGSRPNQGRTQAGPPRCVPPPLLVALRRPVKDGSPLHRARRGRGRGSKGSQACGALLATAVAHMRGGRARGRRRSGRTPDRADGKRAARAQEAGCNKSHEKAGSVFTRGAFSTPGCAAQSARRASCTRRGPHATPSRRRCSRGTRRSGMRAWI